MCVECGQGRGKPGYNKSSTIIIPVAFTEHLVCPGPVLHVPCHQHHDEVGTTDVIVRRELSPLLPPSLPSSFPSFLHSFIQSVSHSSLLNFSQVRCPRLWTRWPAGMALLCPESTIKRPSAGPCSAGYNLSCRGPKHTCWACHSPSVLSLDQLPSQLRGSS